MKRLCFVCYFRGGLVVPTKYSYEQEIRMGAGVFWFMDGSVLDTYAGGWRQPGLCICAVPEFERVFA